MTTPNHTPDLSPANLARVLRQEATVRHHLADETDGLPYAANQHRERAAYLESLADALERQGMAWRERVDAAFHALYPTRAHPLSHDDREFWSTSYGDVESLLRAAFPEFASEAD